jgi:hypothetical protein
MLLTLVAAALAEPTPVTDRLPGVHFGVGVGLGLYLHTETYDDQLLSVASVSSYTSMRVRLGRRFALEPTFRIGRTGGREENGDGVVSTTEHTDSYAVGLRVRPLLASVDRVDLVGLFGATHTRSWREELTGTGDDQLRETSFSATSSGQVGLALEYWITPRLSISGELATDVFSASVRSQEPSAVRETSYSFGFAPSGDMVFHLYF